MCAGSVSARTLAGVDDAASGATVIVCRGTSSVYSILLSVHFHFSECSHSKPRQQGPGPRRWTTQLLLYGMLFGSKPCASATVEPVSVRGTAVRETPADNRLAPHAPHLHNCYQKMYGWSQECKKQQELNCEQQDGERRLAELYATIEGGADACADLTAPRGTNCVTRFDLQNAAPDTGSLVLQHARYSSQAKCARRSCFWADLSSSDS